MRALIAICLCSVVVACDPVRSAYISVVPHPAASTGGEGSSVRLDSIEQAAFALVARVAARRGLEPLDPKHDATLNGKWRECLVRESLLVCERTIDNHIQFWMSSRLPAVSQSDTLRRELADSLSARFGEFDVRVSDWR